MRQTTLVSFMLLTTVLLSAPAIAAPPREKFVVPFIHLPADARVLYDIPYGDAPEQRMDVYLPPHPDHAPVIFMVHGGAWRFGDKGAANVVVNKAERWVSKGFIFVSSNYRMLPDTKPLEQAYDVARALSLAQQKASEWGGAPDKFILMGHSAGAHLVALLGADPNLAYLKGAKPWLGTIVLDSAALDVAQLMQQSHYRLYDRAFGSDPGYWQSVSPYNRLSAGAPPLLAICSTRRSDSCPQAEELVRKASGLKLQARVLKEDLTHGQINELLGKAEGYTDAVENFMASLDPKVARLLSNKVVISR